MVGVLCEVRPGLRDSERAIAIPDYKGRKEHIRIEAYYLRHDGDKTYMPVVLIDEHEPTGTLLVELPYEADSGVRRMAVSKQNSIPIEVPR
jgi:hypothetical protein